MTLVKPAIEHGRLLTYLGSGYESRLSASNGLSIGNYPECLDIIVKRFHNVLIKPADKKGRLTTSITVVVRGQEGASQDYPRRFQRLRCLFSKRGTILFGETNSPTTLSSILPIGTKYLIPCVACQAADLKSARFIQLLFKVSLTSWPEAVSIPVWYRHSQGEPGRPTLVILGTSAKCDADRT